MKYFFIIHEDSLKIDFEFLNHLKIIKAKSKENAFGIFFELEKIKEKDKENFIVFETTVIE